MVTIFNGNVAEVNIQDLAGIASLNLIKMRKWGVFSCLTPPMGWGMMAWLGCFSPLMLFLLNEKRRGGVGYL